MYATFLQREIWTHAWATTLYANFQRQILNWAVLCRRQILEIQVYPPPAQFESMPHARNVP